MPVRTVSFIGCAALAYLASGCAGQVGSGEGTGGVPGSGGRSHAASGSGGTLSVGTGGSGSGSGSGGKGSGGSTVTESGGAGGTTGQGRGGATADGSGGITAGGGAPGSGGGGGMLANAGGATAIGTGGGGGLGAGSNSTPGGGAGTLTCPGDLIFCDDFESYDNQAPPSGQWKTWTVGNATLVVDSMQHASGTKAAHFRGKVSQAAATKEQAFMLAQNSPAFPVTGRTLFLRFMMYGSRFPFTGFSGPNHIDIAWIGSKNALNSPDRGVTNQAYMLADYNGIAIQPMWSGYFRDTSRHFKDANQANAWHCWEIEIDNAGGPPPNSSGTALPHIWEDGVELRLSPAGSGATYAAIPFEAIMFSLWSPQTDNAVADYWIDDVAVSKTRINCPAR